MAKVIVIGAGFSGLAASAVLAKEGHEVVVLEKNNEVGGRARVLQRDGFTFDMGPSWYWMPDVFERFFKLFNKDIADYIELIRLDPSYKVVWGNDDYWDIPATYDELKDLFEKHEKGSGKQLDKFLKDAEYKYNVGVGKLVYNPSSNPLKYLSKEVIFGLFKLQLLSSFRKHAKKYFKDSKILSLIEFPVLFLGATAKEIPALYSLMNYADIKLGTWYTKGGMYAVVEGMHKLAVEQGVKFETNQEVKNVTVENGKIKSVVTDKGEFIADSVLNTADYHHFDTKVLPKEYSQYSKSFWNKKVMAPSCMLYYVGVNKKLDSLEHHNLFFDEDMELHSDEIYKDPKWPTKPLFYSSIASKTDETVAPKGCDNLVLLIPIAAGLEDTEELRDKYFNYIIDKLEDYCKEPIREHILFKESYTVSNFKKDYNSYKGNAYGLANTVLQTAFLRPSIKSKKLDNLFFAGQLSLPGPGVPPSLISGEIAAKELMKSL